MKWLIYLLLFLLCSCASVEYNPKTGLVKYARFGDQQIKGFSVTKKADTIKVNLEGQQSNAQALTDAIQVISKLAVAAPAAGL